MRSELTNAERAERAEAALIAYIEHVGDGVGANEIDTWVGDLLCDLRHLAVFKKFEFNGNAGKFNFEAELTEMKKGHFHQSQNWLKAAVPFTKKKKAPDVELSECCHEPIGYDAWVASDGDVCGGPYDASQCMGCGMEKPAVWDGKKRAWPKSKREGFVAPKKGTQK